MDQEPSKQLEELPASHDTYWQGGDVQRTKPVKLPPICKSHRSGEFMRHVGYRDEGNGAISCTKCDWGTFLPGYMKIKDGKIVDLRTEARK